MSENKTRRVVKIETGQVSEVSEMIASDPKMLLEYGFMLQELEQEAELEEDINDQIQSIVDNNVDVVETETGVEVIIDEKAIAEEVNNLTDKKISKAKLNAPKKESTKKVK